MVAHMLPPGVNGPRPIIGVPIPFIWSWSVILRGGEAGFGMLPDP